MKPIDKVNILVVGDIMLDKYTVGTVERISPEAPVPIVNVTDVYETLGGCGCVAVNVKALGANVWCMASVGDDVYGNRIIDLLNEKGINSLVRKSSKLTTVKERVVAGARQIQMLRLDYEYLDLIYPEKIFPRLASDLKRQPFDYIIVSDYAKGVVTYALIDSLRT
jgi:rfaE bifunctional protein kinase chain/domain